MRLLHHLLTLHKDDVEKRTRIMNSGVNALGQGNRANATIGRALQLVIRNVGGGRPGGVDRATLGNPGKYTFCFAEDETGSLRAAIRADRHPETGEPVFTPATVAALLVFFVFALQCASTLATMRRETNSWRWPAFAFGYLLALAYAASFVTHRVVGALTT